MYNVRRILISAATFALCAGAAAPVLAAPPVEFDSHVEAVRKDAGTPGVAIAIVENGEVTLAKGYGTRKIGTNDKVDADTIFMIGSTGKAFTTAALATLVDAGKIGWDDPVINHIPWFQMYDSWVTREMTVRDLLVHRSGLPLGAGDLLYVPRGDISREELVRRLRFIKPDTSFRSQYAYDNILYAVAGQLIQEVSGQSWEDYMHDHVFAAAGFKSAAATDAVHFGNSNRAFPHGRVGGTVRGLSDQKLLDERDQLGRAAAPAGMIAMSANDMARWLQIQLAHGATPEGGRLFSEQAGLEMWKPVTPMPIAPPRKGLEDMTPSYQAYALGWQVQDYHGTQIVWHAGGLFGFTSIVVLIPEKNVGFAIEVNAEDIQPRYGLMYELLDHYLDRPHQDWPEKFGTYLDERLAAAAAVVNTAREEPVAIGPSLEVGRYAGTYVDPWYGKLVVTAKARDLSVNFTTTPGMTGRLKHWQYDTFVTQFDDKSIEPAYLTFAIGAAGEVTGITARAVSPIADFSFDYHHLNFVPADKKE